MNAIEHLKNYILKRVIKKVHFNKRTLSFVEDKTDLTDGILSSLIQECAKYGLDESDARNLITQTINNINLNPSINKITHNVDITHIPVGQHFKLTFDVGIVGLLSMELLCVEQNAFVVVKSTISGLIPFDVVSSVQQQWNIGHCLQFKVFRKGQSFPNTNSFLQIGKYVYMDSYTPSYIHKLFDSGDDYTFEGFNIKRNTTGVKYINSIHKINGYPSFFTFEKDNDPKTSIFIITPNEDLNTATLELNVYYINELLYKKENCDECIFRLLDCCECINEGISHTVENLRKMTRIELIEPGVVQCSNIGLPNAYWFITAKPVIKFF